MDIVWKAWYTKMSADKICNISMVWTLNMHVPLKRHSIAHTHTPLTRKDCHKRLSEWKLSEVILYRVLCIVHRAPCTCSQGSNVIICYEIRWCAWTAGKTNDKKADQNHMHICNTHAKFYWNRCLCTVNSTHIQNRQKIDIFNNW